MRHEEWKPWTTENYNYLYHYARNKLDDPALIKDLIQDTFLVALESHERFEQRSSELTWLTAILKHKIYRVYRSRARAFVSIAGSDNLIMQGQSYRQGERSVHEAEDPVVSKEFSKALELYLLTLPGTWQQVYELRFVNGFKGSLICDTLHLTPGNYWVINHRLKVALKKWYFKNWR